MAAPMESLLLTLPPEVVGHIAFFLPPRSAVQLSLVCRQLYDMLPASLPSDAFVHEWPFRNIPVVPYSLAAALLDTGGAADGSTGADRRSTSAAVRFRTWMDRGAMRIEFACCRKPKPWPLAALVAALQDWPMRLIFVEGWPEYGRDSAASRACAYMQRVMSRNTKLARLTFMDTMPSVAQSALKGIMAAVSAKTNKCLHYIDVSGCDDLEDCCLEEALASNVGLKILRLEGNGLAEEFLLPLLRSLRANSTLAELDLSKNFISTEDNGWIELLAEGLAHHPVLWFLKLSENHLANDGAEVLAGALRTNTQLRILEACECIIGESGARALAAALLANPDTALERLDLRSNSLGDDDPAAKAEDVLKQVVAQRSIQVDRDTIGVDGELITTWCARTYAWFL